MATWQTDANDAKVCAKIGVEVGYFVVESSRGVNRLQFLESLSRLPHVENSAICSLHIAISNKLHVDTYHTRRYHAGVVNILWSVLRAC